MPGPLSMCKNGHDYAAYDTAEKRMTAGTGFSGGANRLLSSVVLSAFILRP